MIDDKRLNEIEARLGNIDRPEYKPGRCELCGEMMPRGEEMFKYHGYSSPCDLSCGAESGGGEMKKGKIFDSIECECGARLAVGNIGKKETPLLFVGASYKHGMAKTSHNSDQKRLCLWCGKDLPENIIEVLKKALP